MIKVLSFPETCIIINIIIIIWLEESRENLGGERKFNTIHQRGR